MSREVPVNGVHTAHYVEKYIGNAYLTVREVAMNLPIIKELHTNLDCLKSICTNMTAIKKVSEMDLDKAAPNCARGKGF